MNLVKPRRVGSAREHSQETGLLQGRGVKMVYPNIEDKVDSPTVKQTFLPQLFWALFTPTGRYYIDHSPHRLGRGSLGNLSYLLIPVILVRAIPREGRLWSS